MNTKNLLKQIPYVVRFYAAIKTKKRIISNQKVLKQLSDNSYAEGIKLSEVLRQLEQELPQSDQNWITKIEDQRKYLLDREEPLIDGSLGEGGLYDKNVTIKEACMVSKKHKQALLLYLLTCATKPQRVIELGTNVGISSAYIGAALKVNGQNGKIKTLDASPYRQRLAKEIHCNLDLDNISYVEGLFMDTLDGALSNMGSIDLAFIDGHHQYQPTLDYFEKILEFAASDAVFIFDDIRWSDGMKKAWSQIKSDIRLGLIVDLFTIGICVRSQQSISQRNIVPSIYRI